MNDSETNINSWNNLHKLSRKTDCNVCLDGHIPFTPNRPPRPKRRLRREGGVKRPSQHQFLKVNNLFNLLNNLFGKLLTCLMYLRFFGCLGLSKIKRFFSFQTK